MHKLITTIKIIVFFSLLVIVSIPEWMVTHAPWLYWGLWVAFIIIAGQAIFRSWLDRRQNFSAWIQERVKNHKRLSLR